MIGYGNTPLSHHYACSNSCKHDQCTDEQYPDEQYPDEQGGSCLTLAKYWAICKR